MLRFPYDDEKEFLINKYSFFERQKWMVGLMLKSIIGLLVVFYLVSFVPVLQGILKKYQSILASEAAGMQRLPDLQRQIKTLEKQIASLTTQSIETRLNKIETAIQVGDIQADEIATLQKLKEELAILKTYMFRDPTELVELKQLQKNYQEIKERQNRLITKEDVQREISFVNNLFYASISLFGLMLAVMGGSWWFSSRKMKQNAENMQAREVIEKAQHEQ